MNDTRDSHPPPGSRASRVRTARRLLREMLVQRRVPGHVVTYLRQVGAQACSQVRRRLGRPAWGPRHRAAQRVAADGPPERTRVVDVDGAWQAALDFRFTAVREVAEDNLAAVADLLGRSAVPYHVRDAARPGPITVVVEAAHRSRALSALERATRYDLLYARPATGGLPVALGHATTTSGLSRADRVLVYRNHRVGDDHVVGASHGCMIEFWQRAGANLRPPDGARPGRLVPDRAAAAEMVVGGRRYPTVSVFADQGVLSGDVDFPVDVVYTWVDDADPEWRARFADERARRTGLHSQAANVSRYRNRDELRYSLRSLALYAHFVRRVFIVTAGQVPTWLDVDHPVVTLVDHAEILRPADLPTFNSHAIEARLHHIDGLAEHYLYLNDDFILGRQVTAATFFTTNGLAKVFADDQGPIPAGPPSAGDVPVDNASRNVRDLLHTHTGLRVGHKMLHVPYPQRRSVLAEMEKRFPDEFERTAASRFRQPTDVNVASCFFPYYAFATGRAVPADIAAEYVNIGSRWARLQMSRLVERRDRDAFCLNETELPPERAVAVGRGVTRFLDDYLPLPGPFETAPRTPSR